MTVKTRGRPRKYQHEEAMAGALDVFSRKGFTGTSLDDLSAAMGMNRPSIYNAYGDKEAVYREALAFFVLHLRAAMRERVLDEPDLEKALAGGYHAALDAYFADDPPRGCFLFCTAPAEAISRDGIHADMTVLMRELDDTFEKRLRAAKKAGDIDAGADIRSAARLAQGVMHTLAIRARAGESRASLNRLVRFAVGALLGALRSECT